MTRNANCTNENDRPCQICLCQSGIAIRKEGRPGDSGGLSRAQVGGKHMSIIEQAQQATRDAHTGPRCKLAALTVDENAALQAARDRGVTWKQLAAIVAADTTRPELAAVKLLSVSRHVRGECSCEKGEA